MKGMWPTELAQFRDNHLRSAEHRAIMKIAEIEAHVFELYGIEADAENIPAEIKALAFLSFIQPEATPEQAEKIRAEMDRQLAALRKGAH